MVSRKVFGIAWLTATAQVWAGEPASEQTLSEREFFEDLPTVISPTHLKQPLDSSPVAVTVIDRDAIDAMGVRDIADLMRRVAGVFVAHESNFLTLVDYHGFDGGFIRRLQVLIDGQSVYDPVYGGITSWSSLPVEVEDIERIEFVRGPNAATDGANSFFGTVSITTRSPAESSGGLVKSRIGNNGIRDIYTRYSHHTDHGDYSLSAAFREDSGLVSRFDDKRVRYISGRADARLSPTLLLTTKLNYKNSDYGFGFEFDPANILSCIPFHVRPVEGGSFQLRLEYNPNAAEQMFAQAYYNRFVVRSSYFTHPACGGLKDDRQIESSRFEGQIRHVRALSSDARLMVGASVRLDQARGDESTSSADGVVTSWTNTPENVHHRLFGNLEYRFHTDWLLNLGGMVEYHSLIEEWNGSPRLSIHYRLTPHQTLRLGVSRATLIPSFLEQSWKNDMWSKPAGALQAETISSKELGYVYSDDHLRLDGRLFLDHLDNLFGVDVKKFPYQALNEGSATIEGIEIQGRYQITPQTALGFGYAYTDIDDKSALILSDRTAPFHVVDIFLTHQFDETATASLGFNYVSDMKFRPFGTDVPDTRYLDLHVAKKLKSDKGTAATVFLTVQNLLGDQPTFNKDLNVIGRRLFMGIEVPF